jgi:DNA-binding CsgD family transcriptional regulator
MPTNMRELAARSGAVGSPAKISNTIPVSEALVDLVAVLSKLEATISLPPTFADPVRTAGLLSSRNLHLVSNARTGEVLTHTEIRVLHYLVSHLTVREIATELCRSVETVSTHVRHLYRKLDAHTRSEAVRNARACGLLA